ncbi:protein kinase superfamily protein [Actinidia rufa]|uniref:Protein kinase superfamily protein n=1 Tax=Actinidia rufa TaxID=165716 RepID=A0A7J0H9F7_9ERIC|nr:protein kinase superfamily protein [Actinidia rufa]
MKSKSEQKEVRESSFELRFEVGETLNRSRSKGRLENRGLSFNSKSERHEIEVLLSFRQSEDHHEIRRT